MTNNCLIVLGMHRSGTSAATRACNLLGVDFGTRLMAPSPDNPLGHWEHDDIVPLHEKLLKVLESSWDDVRKLPKNWQYTKVAKG